MEALLAHADRREKALTALMAYGGLRRSEIVALNIGDFAPDLGLRKVHGKGGHESAVRLPEVARNIVAGYLAADRAAAGAKEPLFLVRYRTRGARVEIRRISAQRIWKIVKGSAGALGCRSFTRMRFAMAAVSNCCGDLAGIYVPFRNTSGTPISRQRPSTLG